MKRNDVYALIDGERDYQDRRWNSSTTETAGLHSVDEFILYMKTYLRDAEDILSHESANTGRPKALEIVRKVTAMGVSCMEQHNTSPRIFK